MSCKNGRADCHDLTDAPHACPTPRRRRESARDPRVDHLEMEARRLRDRATCTTGLVRAAYVERADVFDALADDLRFGRLVPAEVGR